MYIYTRIYTHTHLYSSLNKLLQARPLHIYVCTHTQTHSHTHTHTHTGMTNPTSCSRQDLCMVMTAGRIPLVSAYFSILGTRRKRTEGLRRSVTTSWSIYFVYVCMHVCAYPDKTQGLGAQKLVMTSLLACLCVCVCVCVCVYICAFILL